MIKVKTRHEIARCYGYELQSGPNADLLVSRHNGSTMARIDNSWPGKVTMCVHDAHAHTVARLVACTQK